MVESHSQLVDHLPLVAIQMTEEAIYHLYNKDHDTDHAGRLAEVSRLQNHIGEIVVGIIIKELGIQHDSPKKDLHLM